MAFKKLTGKLGVVNARHLAHRATFNPNLTLINKLAAMDVDQAVNYLLNYGYANLNILARTQRAYKFREYPREIFYGKYYIPTQLNPYAAKTHTDITDEKLIPKKDFRTPYFDKALYTWYLNEFRSCKGAQFKISFFLHIQFICSLKSGALGGNIFSAFDYLDLINFFVNRSMRTMTKRIAICDAMTKFYNNDNNDVKNGFDENLGREIMELFTVQSVKGIPPFDPKGDVKSASRVISGYKVNGIRGKKMSELINQRIASMDRSSGVPLSIMKIESHDPKDKTFGTYFSKKTIKGTKSVSGALGEKDQLVDMLFAAPNTSIAYATNLYRYFVCPYDDDALDRRIVNELSRSLKANDFNLHKVLFELFTSREFYDLTDVNGVNQSPAKQGTRYIGGKIKNPLEFSLILLDQLKINPPTVTKWDAKAVNDQITFYNKMVRNFCESSGMKLFDVLIDGYQFAFRQKEYDRSWVTTNSVLARQEYVRNLVESKIDAKKFVESTFKNPKDADGLLEQMINYFLPRPYAKGSVRFNNLKEAMLSGLDEKSWPYEYDTPGAKIKLQDALKHLLTSPDYLVL